MINVALRGDRQLRRTFKALPDTVQKKLSRQAMTAAAKPIVAAARKRIPKRTGLLRKSLGVKVGQNKRKTGWYAVIGVRKDKVGKKAKPSRYAHLVEKGFTTRSGKHVPARPWLRPAFYSSTSASLVAIRTKLKQGIEKEAKCLSRA